jgi:glycosyltransferase involved in cell wall biosynthesis
MQFNTFVAATFGHLIARLAKRPVLLWCHEMFGELWKLVGRNVIERKLYPVIEKLIAMAPHSHIACPSLYSAQTLRKMGARRAISVIPHGIDFNIFHPRKDVLRKELGLEDTKLFGFTGRLFVRGTGQSKNLLLLLEATKCIVKESPNTKLLLGGIGFEELAPFVDQMGLQDHVVYAGARKFEEVPLFYAACDVIVCPALADGFCFLLAEASACGVPVVATRCGAHPERVIHRKTGFLVEPDASSLADAVLRILWDENLARRMGEAGRKHALRFAWDKSVRKHLQIYEQLLTMH